MSDAFAAPPAVIDAGAEPLPHYTFLPWSRRGIATQIDQMDHLGERPSEDPKGRATLTAEVTVETLPVAGGTVVGPTAVRQMVALVGPGDVKAFKPDTVLRTVPVRGALNATSGELAFIEFYDEDFPWRYTPARATADHHLRPWVALLVLAEGEYTLLPRPGEPDVLVVDDAATLPPATETWAWAHVQVSGRLDDVAGLDELVRRFPDHALSRLLSPRRLRSNCNYHGFVVPAFESGRLAGLGTPDPGVPAQRQSWGDGQQRRFPVLYDWGWRTGEVADFETLAKRPCPLVVGEAFGKRVLDVSDPGAGVPVRSEATVELEGALRPIKFPRTAFPIAPGLALAADLQELVDRAEDFRTANPDEVPDDPVVGPPAYARRAAGLQRIADAEAVPEAAWLVELNLDPRNRAAAGLGAMIVRQRDEELMERAWAQVADLSAVNQRLREADLALATNERIFAKHVASGDPDRLLILTAATHSALAAPVVAAATGSESAARLSVRGQVDASRVPAAAQAPAFRRISRPQRRLVRNLAGDTGIGLRTGLLDRLNTDPDAASALSTAPPAAEPALGLPFSAVGAALSAAADKHANELPRPKDQFMLLAHAEVAARIWRGLYFSWIDGGLAALQRALLERLDVAVPSPPWATEVEVTLRTAVQAIIAGVLGLEPVDPYQDLPDEAVMTVDSSVFSTHFGDGIDGQTYRGLMVAPPGSTFDAITTTIDTATIQDYVSRFSDLTWLAAGRSVPPPPAALTKPATLAEHVASRLRPRTSLPSRLNSLLGGVGDLTAELITTRRLKPVLAHPQFPDPLFEPLRMLSQDYIVPNIADLPPESIAVMTPNTRFIESVLAGASTEMGRELLWNEYPTDQRGTYFTHFFDARDAGVAEPEPDIADLHTWCGALGCQSRRVDGLLVLVMRAELLVKFPNTVVFAQQARFTAGRRRTPADDGDVKYPVLRGHLDPDIELYGFELTAEQAVGTADAGYFFCFMERPGHARFGLDSDEPPPALESWDNLAWGHLQPAEAEQILIDPNTVLAPALPVWGTTAAHMASILCQSPVLLARHASDMLPTDLLPTPPQTTP